MKILITGGNGQLGRELFHCAKNDYSVISLNKQQLDVTDFEKVRLVITYYMPDVIIHTAAYTAVDQCETEQLLAMKVNALGAYHVAMVAEKIGAKMVYVSTDYVFSGEKKTPYCENDEPSPQNVYGMSKYLGEQLVLKTVPSSYIVRTSWLYGQYGHNFVKTILKISSTRDEIFVVSDQIGSPTYTQDVAQTILDLLRVEPGVYHVSNTGACSWFEFARTILNLSGEDSSKIKPITTLKYNQVAKRPSHSVLGHKELENQGVQGLRHWKEALSVYLHKD